MMSGQPEPTGATRSTRARNRRVGWTIRITPFGVVLLVVFNLLVLSALAIGITQILQMPNLPWQVSQVDPFELPFHRKITNRYHTHRHPDARAIRFSHNPAIGDIHA